MVRANRGFHCLLGVALGVLLTSTQPADATFHLMQIEQVIGGVNGDTSAQAVQLRMRAAGQHFVSASRLRAWDAAGANPVLLTDFTTDLTGPSALGDRILIATASFASKTTPAAVPDYVMAAIPASYLAAGSLTFERDTGAVLWRLSWGGASYTGSNSGEVFTNDSDGNFGPPFASPLPSERCVAIRFAGLASALSVSNSTDYAIPPIASDWTNYNDATFVISYCVPAVSEWGLFAMSLALLTVATQLIRRRSFAGVAIIP